MTEEGLRLYAQLLDDMRLSQLEWYSSSSIEEKTKTMTAYNQRKNKPSTSKNTDSSDSTKEEEESFLMKVVKYGFFGAVALTTVKLMGGGPLLKGTWRVAKWVVVKGVYDKALKPVGNKILNKETSTLSRVTGRRRIITLNSGEQVMLSRAAYRDYIYLRDQYQELMSK